MPKKSKTQVIREALDKMLSEAHEEMSNADNALTLQFYKGRISAFVAISKELDKIDVKPENRNE